MKATGMSRKIDELGRLVVPKELRDTMDVNSGDGLEFYVDGDKIMLKKYQPGCVLCSQIEENQQDFRGYTICSECKSELQHMTDNIATAAEIV